MERKDCGNCSYNNRRLVYLFVEKLKEMGYSGFFSDIQTFIDRNNRDVSLLKGCVYQQRIDVF